ncbi:hypothetical protein [Streptomyces sp. NPDC006446]|uniref:hypothetical protein n=1 Tax=Streptomyces sp. NPDC006446 TaxID=3154301 RepID=UPI0033A073B4
MSPAPRLEPIAGGWLLARDLRDGPRMTAVRSAQHHVAAHRSWGCSAGLRVRLADGVLTVTPGLAVDLRGRIAVLPAAVRCRYAAGDELNVVLVVRGDGPAAQIVTRRPGQRRSLDVPLGAVDAAGGVHDGDGDRQWLRLPGPARQLGGIVARGAPVTGVASAWTAHVDLSRHRLDGPPAVIGSAAGPAPDPTAGTTIQVSDIDEAGFDLVVRHAVQVGSGPSHTTIATAPLALAWLALLPAARPGVPDDQEVP